MNELLRHRGLGLVLHGAAAVGFTAHAVNYWRIDLELTGASFALAAVFMWTAFALGLYQWLSVRAKGGTGHG